MKNKTVPSTRPAAKITTQTAAARHGTKPQTWRAGYCRDGHYLGIVPTKLPNGRLLWDESDVDALANGQPAKAPDAADLDKHQARKAADASKVPAHIRAKTEAKGLTTVGGA